MLPAADDSLAFTLLVTGMFMGAFALLFQVSLIRSCPEQLHTAAGAGLSSSPPPLLPPQSKLLIWGGVFMTLAAYTHMPYDSQNVTQLLVMVLT